MKNEERPIRLLLVDDDEFSREVLTLQISAQGYAVETAESGDAALAHLEQAGQHLPDAVLTDLRMPGIAGLALALQLRAIGDAAGSPGMVLLAMSASQPDEDLHGAYNGFLLKPFTMQHLAEALQLNPVPTASAAPGGASGSNHRVSAWMGAATTAAWVDETVNLRFAASMPAAKVQEFYEFCLDDSEARIGRMRLAAAAGDDTEYRRQAHTIKGSGSMVGAVELQRLAAQEETRGIDPANHVASLDEMLSACGRLRRILIAREDRATE